MTVTPVPLNLTRRSGGVVVGGAKFVPVIVTSWLSRPCTSGPLAAVTIGVVPVISKAPVFVTLCSALTLVTVTSRTSSGVSRETLRVTVICVGPTETLVTKTPGPKETLASGAKFAPVSTTTRPTAPSAAVAGETFVRVGPTADVTTVPFFTDWDKPSRPGLGPKIVVSTSAEVTSGGRKPGGTSTLIPDTRALAGPRVEA